MILSVAVPQAILTVAAIGRLIRMIGMETWITQFLPTVSWLVRPVTMTTAKSKFMSGNNYCE